MKIVYNIFLIKSTVFPKIKREYTAFFRTGSNREVKIVIRKKNKRLIKKAARPLRCGARHIPSDVLGSYTGTGINGEAPEQDADDL